VRLLLDTHIWIWSLLDPGRLSARVKRALRQVNNELWLSPISVWETLLLIEKGRIVPAMGAADWLDAALARSPLHEAPITHAIARESRRIMLPHTDPADRFIAATARVLDLTLVTSDTRLLGCKDIVVLANR